MTDTILAAVLPGVTSGPSVPTFDPVAAAAFAQRLQASTMAVKLMHTKLGLRKALDAEQVATMAELYGAEGSAVSGSKRLLPGDNPALRRLGRIRRNATKYWRSVTVPYPEPGVRLIRRDRVAAFVERMKFFQAEMEDAAALAELRYQEMLREAADELGALFDADDYPESIADAFGLDWSFPALEPDPHLKSLHKELFDQERARIAASFNEAVRLTEEAFELQLYELVKNLAGKLRGDEDGQPKKFKDASVENVNRFFATFRELDLGSSTALQALVDQAQLLVGGVDPDELRKDGDVRRVVLSGLVDVQAGLEAMMTARPTRAIRVRPTTQPTTTDPGADALEEAA